MINPAALWETSGSEGVQKLFWKNIVPVKIALLQWQHYQKFEELII